MFVCKSVIGTLNRKLLWVSDLCEWSLVFTMPHGNIEYMVIYKNRKIGASQKIMYINIS